MDIDKIHIITVATEQQYYFPYLVDSCRKNGKELEVIGMGEKWEGFNWRYKKMIDYLKNLPKNDIVCFIDGYDVLCCRNLHELIPEFLKIQHKQQCKIVVGHDKTSFLLSMHSLFYGKCKNQSINAGTYIGSVIDILDIIQKTYDLNPNNDADDQILITQYCNLNPNDFYIDTDNQLFLVLLYPLENLDKYTNIDNGKLTYNNNTPFFIHAPGYGLLDNIINKLGYSYIDNIKEEYYKNIFEKKILFYTKIILVNYFIYILFGVIVFYKSFSYMRKSKIINQIQKKILKMM